MYKECETSTAQGCVGMLCIVMQPTTLIRRNVNLCLVTYPIIQAYYIFDSIHYISYGIHNNYKTSSSLVLFCVYVTDAMGGVTYNLALYDNSSIKMAAGSYNLYN